MKKNLIFIFTFVLIILGSSISPVIVSAAGNGDFIVEEGVLIKYLGDDINLVIPDELGIESIAHLAFAEGVSIVSINLPNTLKHLNLNRFSMCFDLKEIYISKSVEKIEYFSEDPSEINIPTWAPIIETIQIDEENPFYISNNNIIYTRDKTKLVYCANGISGDINVLDGVKTIGAHSFYECFAIKEIKIPGSVTEIDETAFGMHYAYETPETGGAFLEKIYCVKGSAGESFAKKNMVDIEYYDGGLGVSAQKENNQSESIDLRSIIFIAMGIVLLIVISALIIFIRKKII